MNIKVPYLTNTQIESMSLELLGKYEAWKRQKVTPPIDIDEIIEGFFKLSLALCDLRQHLSIPDVLGATWLDEKIIRIDSSLEEKEGRLSFTMAHEVGHWFMHRPIYEMDKASVPLFGYGQSSPSAAIVCRAIGRKEPAERQADQFAAMLLAPAKFVRATVNSITNSGQIVIEDLERYGKESAKNPSLRNAAKAVIDVNFSNVSIEAMCYRLIDLKLVVDSNPTQISMF